MKMQVLGVLTVVLAVASARTWRQFQRSNFIGDGSNEVATNILQSTDVNKQNYVFSPFGYSTILAVLTEGARGNTRNQLVSSLKLPEDTYAVRSSYKRVLSDMTEKEAWNKPEFKNWFYVYKNYTVEKSYKNLLKENYLIDVKEVDRDSFFDNEQEVKKPLETVPTQAPVNTNPNNNANQGGNKNTRKDSSEEVDKHSSEENISKESAEDLDSKEKVSKEKDSKEDDSKENDSSEERERRKNNKLNKKPSNVMKIKIKETIERVQEVPQVVVQDPVPPVTPETTPSAPSEPEPTDSPTAMPEVTKRESVKIEVETQDVKALDGSIDVRISVRPKRDVTTVLTANRLSPLNTERESGLAKLSRMIVFNALYFRGNWSTRFTSVEQKMPFQVKSTEDLMVDMIQAEDEFETGRIPELEASAINIPYQGDKYCLLIIVPDDSTTLDNVVQKLDDYSFNNIDNQLTKLRTKVFIPKLRFDTISRPKEAFIKSGIVDLFNEDADLSGISGNKGLLLEDLVQLVTFEIDESQSSYNFLTTSSVSDMRASSVPFTADKPFLFFLRDRIDNINIIAGAVANPAQAQ